MVDNQEIADKFNIMVIGDEKVGKTTILERYFNRKFNSERKKTIGVEYYNKNYTFDKNKKTYSLKFWDTAGQEKFRSVAKNYYQRAHGMIITMAVDNRSSFNNLKMWVNSVHENSKNSNMPLVILSNKIDLPDEDKEVKKQEVEDSCNEEDFKIKYFFTSAKSGEHIDEAFDYIIKSVIKANTDGGFKSGGKSLSEGESPGKSGTCC